MSYKRVERKVCFLSKLFYIFDGMIVGFFHNLSLIVIVKKETLK